METRLPLGSHACGSLEEKIRAISTSSQFWGNGNFLMTTSGLHLGLHNGSHKYVKLNPIAS